MIQVGCFELEEITSMRWRVRNTLTTHEHVTYGTLEEVKEQLERQSAQWQAKTDKTKPKAAGSAWRGRAAAEINAKRSRS